MLSRKSASLSSASTRSDFPTGAPVMQADANNPSDAVWWPDRATLEGANLTHFMRALGVCSFEELNERASADPTWFHDELIRFLDYRFVTPYENVLDASEGLPFARWCVGGVTNVVMN